MTRPVLLTVDDSAGSPFYDLVVGKLRGVDVVRDYAEGLPPVPAYPAELNQVWTNLIDNAVVEVADDRPGISPEVLPHSHRIVERRHGGRIDVDTGPQGTTFSVRLPLHR